MAGIGKTMRNISAFHFGTFQYVFQHLGWKNRCPSNFKGKNSCNLEDNQSNLSAVILMSYMILWVENLISYLISLSL